MAPENTRRAFWVRSPGSGEIRSGPLPPPGDGEVRVRTLFSGISRGTESLVFRGAVPPSQHDAMRCPFQEGAFPAPVKYGYMNVGTVEACGPGAEALRGRTVFCLHPHQDRYVVPADAVVPLPDDVPAARAILAANLETAINGVWDAGPGPGDRVVVIGGGVVGMLAAWLCRSLPGGELLLVDPEPAREETAARLSIPWAPSVPEALKADRVLHASGSAEGLRAALGVAGDEAVVVELSWFGDAEVGLPLGEDFHARRLTLRSSQVGRIPPDRAPRWDHRRRLDLALRLLADPRLDVLITGESDFEALPEVMARLASDPGATLCHRIRYEPA
ncbi:MAG TPA: zinc-binding alcohol dehydrogenase [Longimicrobiales bacterium]|nr:zinc-binding alcohol dehydrogenase [Longimicrobiales bacterium]